MSNTGRFRITPRTSGADFFRAYVGVAKTLFQIERDIGSLSDDALQDAFGRAVQADAKQTWMAQLAQEEGGRPPEGYYAEREALGFVALAIVREAQGRDIEYERTPPSAEMLLAQAEVAYRTFFGLCLELEDLQGIDLEEIRQEVYSDQSLPVPYDDTGL